MRGFTIRSMCKRRFTMKILLNATPSLVACVLDGPKFDSSDGIGNDIIYSMGNHILNESRMQINIDDCMIVKGYTRYQIKGANQKAFLEKLKNLPPESRALYHSSDSPPEGDATRTWNNALYESGLTDLPNRPSEYDFAPVGATDATSDTEPLKAPKVISIKSVKAGKPIRPQSDEAVVVLTGQNLSPRKIGAITFALITPTEGKLPTMSDENGVVYLLTASLKGRKQPREFVYVVPAGTYVLSQLTNGGRAADHVMLCYGTLTASIQAGEVVSFGEWQFNNRKFRMLNNGLDVAADALSMRTNGDDFRQNLKPAKFENGQLLGCGSAFGRNYRFEDPGFPFRD